MRERPVVHNDVLRRLRDILGLEDERMIAVFALGERAVDSAQLRAWLSPPGDPAPKVCGEAELSAFLDGLIVDRRGPREDAQPAGGHPLTNNAIFMKLKIAFDLQAEAAVETLAVGGHSLTKRELSAFFRRAGHKHYRECGDEVLLAFLDGLQRQLS